MGREGELLIPRGNIFQELLRKRASMQPSGKIGGLVDLRYTVPRLAKNYYNELLDTCRMRHGKWTLLTFALDLPENRSVCDFFCVSCIIWPSFNIKKRILFACGGFIIVRIKVRKSLGEFYDDKICYHFIYYYNCIVPGSYSDLLFFLFTYWTYNHTTYNDLTYNVRTYKVSPRIMLEHITSQRIKLPNV